MDYQKIYQNLISRSKNRILSGYKEKHHIIPKCLGGSDNNDNIAELTGREHYIAHLLLVKMHPKNGRLIKAAAYMTIGSSKMKRSKNRLYEWLRIKLSKELSLSQTGDGNSQFGKIWIYSLTEKRSLKIDPDQFDYFEKNGWKKGRKIKFEKMIRQCVSCKKEFQVKTKENFCSNQCRSNERIKKGVFYGREKEFLEYYQSEKSLNKACQKMGFPGAVGAYYRIGKKIIEENNMLS